MLDHHNFQHRPSFQQHREAPAPPPARNAPGQVVEWMAELLAELGQLRDEARLRELEANHLRKELATLHAERESERQHYQQLIGELPYGTFRTDKAGVIQEANSTACTLLGLQDYFLIGKPLLTYISMKDHSPYCVQLARLRLGRSFRELELELAPRQGEPLTVLVQAMGSYDAAGRLQSIRWVVRPVKFRQTSLTALIQSYQTLYTLFAASPLAVIALDMQNRVTLWNRSAEEMLGWRATEVMGHPVPPLLYGAEHSRTMLRLGHDIQRSEGICQRRDGSEIAVRISAAPLYDADQRQIGVMALLDDISEARQMAEELRHVQQRLAESREEERLHLARELHDTVIQQLVGLSYQASEGLRRADMAEDSPHDAALAPIFDSLRDGAGEALRQLRGVLRELRPAGLEEFGLSTALRGYLTDLQASLAGQPPRLEWQIDGEEPNLPPLVALCLFRVAQEGITNALKHAQARTLALRLTLTPYMAHLRLRDDGLGFEVPPCLFSLAQENHFGLLGMQERIACVGGTLRIDSQPGRGSRLTICIPLAPEGERDG